MVANLSSVEHGMDVYDSTGDKIGSVADVLTLAAFSQSAQTDPYAATTADMTGTIGAATGATDQNAVVKVTAGGVLGIGGKDLYIPFDAIQTITPGQSITINCAKAQCESLYAQKPSFLENA